jgi:purine-binding chemotaxis protein CheW
VSRLAQLSTFLVNGYLFGVEVATVQEVIRYQPMTRVPLAPPALSGLINLRGQVIAAVDLRHRLASPTGRPASCRWTSSSAPGTAW